MYHNITQAAAQASVWALKRISEPIWAEERINITVQIPESTRKTICTEMKKSPEKSCESWYCWSTVLESASSKWTSKNRATIIAQKASNIQSKQNVSDRDVFTLSLHRRSSTVSDTEFKVRAKHRHRCNSLRPTKLWNSEFDGVWVLYTNFGYLRYVNAGLRHVESSLRARRHISKRYASTYERFLTACAEVSHLQRSPHNLGYA